MTTCHCHDPHVFGHLHCPNWETQPRARQPLTQPGWDTTGYHVLTHTLQALTGALTAASGSIEALTTAMNPPQPRQTNEN